MSREKKFHQWIEGQNQEEKARIWEKIQEKMDVDTKDEPTVATVVEEITPNEKPKGIWRKGLAIATASIVAVCISVFAVMKFFSDEGIVAGNSNTSETQSDAKTSEDSASSGNSEIPPSTNENRYCTAEEYTRSVTDKTIKQYAQETGKDILYFDWYDATEHLENSIYTLNETNEIICYRENIINPETGDLLSLYVTEKSIQIDVLEKISMEVQRIDVYNGVTITWGVWVAIGHASFEYGDYKYDIELTEPLEEDDVLEYAKLLLGE